MYELLWCLGGALTYKILAKLFRLTQLYLFFQELHLHILIMLQAAAHDLDAAREMKTSMLEATEFLGEDAEKIDEMDKEAIIGWKEGAAKKLQAFIPGPFKTTIQYNSWNGLIKYMNDIKK